MRIELKNTTDSNVLITPIFKEKTPRSNVLVNKIVKQNPKMCDELKVTYSYNEQQTLILVGLGEEKKFDQEKARKLGAKVYQALKSQEIKKAAMLEFTKKQELVQGFAEGAYLASYAFDKYKKEKDTKFEVLTLVSKENFKQTIDSAEKITEGVCITRDLVNEIPSTCHPQYLAEYTKKLFAKSANVKVKIMQKAELEKMKMGCLLGVARGSSVDPCVIVIEYTGTNPSKKKQVLVGKGITFDSGGLNLKPTGFMETMKDDMAGAAAIIGTIKALESLKVPINVTGILACVENLLGSNSYRPGDVLISSSGKTVEVANTDAEGRLVLSDCLHYATSLKPEAIIDLATLTGAALVALGKQIACIMGNNQELIDKLRKAGETSYERSWQLPLYEEFKEDIKGSIADIKNTGKPKGEAGTIAGGMFLQEFIGEYPWVHLDIAGPVWADSAKHYISEGGTGFGVRLLVQYFRDLNNK